MGRRYPSRGVALSTRPPLLVLGSCVGTAILLSPLHACCTYILATQWNPNLMSSLFIHTFSYTTHIEQHTKVFINITIAARLPASATFHQMVQRSLLSATTSFSASLIDNSVTLYFNVFGKS